MSTSQMPLFYIPPRVRNGPISGVATTPELEALLALHPATAFSISGGKDGTSSALAATRYLDGIGHKGPRLCVHADLGRIEWRDSLPMCRELADHLGLELLVVRRGKGDMIEQWRQRWSDNVERYRNLACATLIMPWSTARWRFCTSGQKSSPIASALKKRFPHHPLVSVMGIRREESAARAAKPIAEPNERLERAGLPGMTWNAIIEYRLQEVWSLLDASGLRRHVAYEVYKSTRVSCTACVLASLADLQAAARCPDNHAAHVAIVELEADSAFSFQSGRWLADVAPWLLDDALCARIGLAKELARERVRLESLIPPQLMFKDQLPTQMPSREQAHLLAAVRREVGQLYGMAPRCTTADAVLARYAQLLRHGKRALRKPCPDAASTESGLPAPVIADPAVTGRREQLNLELA